ncbi:MAG: hypothetical protein GY758_00725, partial [Fuerstiella sp.]|nr:hypothetical protein [Fuerstiella sp.]
LTVGRSPIQDTHPDFFNGYLDEIRIVKGRALWTEDFTPKYTPGTKLLIRSDNPDGDGTFADSSGENHQIIRGNNIAHSTSAQKIGSSSVFFNGNSQYLELADSDDWNFGAEDFTISVWVYPTSYGTWSSIFNQFQHPGPDAAFMLHFNTDSSNTGTVTFAASRDGKDTPNAVWLASISVVPLNTWTHLAVTRSGDTFRLFVSGTEDARETMSGALHNSGHPLIIGSQPAKDNTFFSGYMDEIRIVKGEALWDFVSQPVITVPQTSYTVAENETLSFKADGFVPDGGTPVFTGSGLPGGAVMDPVSGVFSWTPGFEQAGEYTVTFTVTDPEGATDSANVTFTVTDTNRAPVLETAGHVAVEVGMIVTFQVPAQDPDGDPLTFSLTAAPGGMTMGSDTGLITWTPEQDGEHEITVHVSDTAGASDTETYIFSVRTASDRIPPVLSISAPSRVRMSGVVNIEAQASDDRGVDKVIFYIDDVPVKEFSEPPYALSWNAPAEPGKTLYIRVTASDIDLNMTEAFAQVYIERGPDTTPPVIVSATAPASAGPGETVRIRAEVTDDRGVASVRFSVADTEIGTDVSTPYEASFTVPDNAQAGTVVTADILALDAEGNSASDQVSFTVAETADRVLPLVSLQVPEEAAPGRTVVLKAEASDNTGVMKTEFYTGSALLAEDTEAPYEFSYTVPETVAPGTRIEFRASAEDFAGNTAESDTVYMFIAEPAPGFIIGEVYDDSAGLPLHEVSVRAVSAGGEVSETQTDISGRYSLALSEGKAVILAAKQGYASCTREVNVHPGTAVFPQDARLTPLGQGISAGHTAGESISPNSRISVFVSAGTFGEDTEVTVTELGEQGLPFPLPAGWNPVCAVHIGPDDRAGAKIIEVSFFRPEFSEEAAVPPAARWDSETREWIRLESAKFAEKDGIFVPAPGTGTVALILPDSPEGPAVPDIGKAFYGSDPKAVPDETEANILPDPKIIFVQADTQSEVRAVLNTGESLPGGTLIQVLFTESYELADGTRISRPDYMIQDIVLYRRSQGMTGYFTAAPSCLPELSALVQGSVKLDAGIYGIPVSAAVSPAEGGAVTTADGILTLVFPPESSETGFPVSLRMLTETDPVFADDTRFGLLSGIPGAEVYTGHNLPAQGGTLTVLASVPAGTQAVAVRPSVIGGVTRYVISAAGVSDGNSITFGSNVPGLPGIRENGRYYMLTLNEPAAWVTGRIQSGGAPAEKAAAETDRFPFVSLTDTENPVYALPVPPNTETAVTGSDLIYGQSVTGTVTPVSQDEVLTLDLELSPVSPRVISTVPADGSTDIYLLSPVTVTFSRKISAGTVNTASFGLYHDSAPAAGAVTVSPDGLSAVFRPSAPLEQNTVYTAVLTDSITDTFGNPLSGETGPFEFSFGTKDTTPPERPDAGQITLTIPDPEDGGVTQITGTQGTAEPGVVVTVRNSETGASVSVIANTNGSFGMTSDGDLPLLLEAEAAHRIEIEFTDEADNTVSFYPGPFRNEDGTTVISSEGGIVEGPEDTGISAVVPRGALPDGTPVRVDSMTGYDLEAAGAKGLEFKGGIFLDIPDGITAEKEITLSVPLPDIGDLTENNLLVFTEIIFFGQPRIMLIGAGNIETWETGWKRKGDYSYGMTCGTFSKGPHMFFKAMYPQKMAIYTPSPLMGPIMIDIKSKEYGDVFADPLYFKTSPICFVPTKKPFDIKVLSTDTGQILSELPDNYIGDASQFFIPDPANKGQEIGIYPWPGDGDTNIPVNSSVRIDFSFDVVEASLTLTEVSEKYGDISAPGNSVTSATQITFTPERRLKYGTSYRVDLNVIPNNGFSSPPQSESLSYTTAHVRVTGSPETDFQCFPSDIAILSEGCEVAVANGTLSSGTAENTGFHKNSHGVLIFDYSDRKKPFLKYEKAISGNTLGVCDAGGEVLSVSGGLDDMGVFNILEPAALVPVTRGRTYLSEDYTTLVNGYFMANVPPYAGIPRRVAFLEDAGAAYIAAIGIGIQGVELATARQDMNSVTNSEEPALFAYGSSVTVPSPVTVKTLKQYVLAGNMQTLTLLDAYLKEMDSCDDVPARDIDTVADYPVTEDDGSKMSYDLVFAAGHGNDKNLYIVAVTDSGEFDDEKKSSVPFIDHDDFITDDFRLQAVRISPDDRLAFVSTSFGVYIVDIDKPFETGGVFSSTPLDENDDKADDRIIGKISDESENPLDSETGSIDILDDTGFVAEAGTGKVLAFKIPHHIANSDAKCTLGNRIKLTGKEYPLPAGETAKATISPEGANVIWSLENKADGVIADIDPNSGIIDVKKESGVGCVTVRATDPEVPCCVREAKIEIGCRCNSESCRGATVEFLVKSISARFRLGNTAGGRPAGDIWLEAETPSKYLATPEGLKFSSIAEESDVQAVYDNSGFLRQAIAPETVADIVILNEYSYK